MKADRPQGRYVRRLIGRWIKYLWPHVHVFETTHTNRYFLATAQVCRCGLSREVISHPHAPHEYEKYFSFWWRYSDGRHEKDERVFKHTIVLQPPLS